MLGVRTPVSHITARSGVLAFAVTLCAMLLSAAEGRAQTKLTFLTSWYAQAEHGGFYQAKATGLYAKEGLDVTIRMGGPQVSGMQLLLGGEVDIAIGYDFQMLKSLEQSLPVVTIAASFQNDLQGLLTHEDVKSLADLKDKTILVATPGRTSWWPWLKAKYGYTDEQTKPYTFNLQPFFADKAITQQSYPTSEPFQVEQANIPYRFHHFAASGYPPYGTTMVTTRGLVEKNRDAVAKFVRASLQGWADYISKDNTAANVLIKTDNPKMTDAQIAFAIKQLKALKVIDGGDAATKGVGVMTPERWKATYEYMVGAGLLKPDVDWTKAFTTEFVKDLKIVM